MTEDRKAQLLESFLKEFFDFNSLCKAGLFSKEIKTDYNKQAEILCKFLGLKSIYEIERKAPRL